MSDEIPGEDAFWGCLPPVQRHWLMDRALEREADAGSMGDPMKTPRQEPLIPSHRRLVRFLADATEYATVNADSGLLELADDCRADLLRLRGDDD